jgi:phosphatidylserine decarboxylase
MFAREGYVLIAGSIVVGVLLALAALWMDSRWSIIPWLLGFLVVAFTLYFFRDPKRIPPAVSDWAVLAPADGKVVVIDEIEEPLYLKSKAQRISIFLSPLNVHVNRIPIAGTIAFERYVPGDYLVAWHPKASELNERSEIGVEHASGARILFKQIAGAVARRIVYHVKVGDRVSTGERFGIVKFGSRMDVFMPLGSEVSVQLGDRVRGGQTIIGTLDSPSEE